MIFQIVIVYIFIGLLNFRELLKMENGRTIAFVIYGVVYISGFTISYLLVIDKAPTSPAAIIENVLGLIMGR